MDSNKGSMLSKHLRKYTQLEQESKFNLLEQEVAGSAFETELLAWTAHELEPSESCSELDDHKDASPIAEKNRLLYPASTEGKDDSNNLLLLSSKVVYGFGDSIALAQEARGNDLPHADLIEEIQNNIGVSLNLKSKVVRCPLPEITLNLGTENVVRTAVDQGSLYISSGSGRPDLEEDDTHDVSGVVYDIENVDRFHSDAKAVRNVDGGASNFAVEGIGLPDQVRKCFPDFHLADEEETSLHLQKPPIEPFYCESQDACQEGFPFYASQRKVQDIVCGKEVDCLFGKGGQMFEARHPLAFDQSSAIHALNRSSMQLGSLSDVSTIHMPTAEENIIYKPTLERNDLTVLMSIARLKETFSCDTKPNSKVNDAVEGEKEYPGPDELSQNLEALDMNESYVDTVRDMEDVLLDSGEISRAGFVHPNKGLPFQPHRPYRDGGLSASTSDGHNVYQQIEYCQRIDLIEVLGAKQRSGGASFGERLVGVKEYTVYQIGVHSGRNQWVIERRYRDFIGLYRQLKGMFATENDVHLPSPWENIERESRKVFGNASSNVVEERCALIQECLSSLIQAGAPFDTAPPLFCFLLPCRNLPNTTLAFEDKEPVSMQKGSEVKGSSSHARGFDFFQFLSSMPLSGRIVNEHKQGDMEEISSFGKTIRLIVHVHPQKPLKQVLEAQHYLCAGCHKHLDVAKGLIQGFAQNFGWGKPRLCEYTGQLFCTACHLNETAVLPARVLQLWDFTPCPVSQLAKAYLDSIYDQPMLCVSAVNPRIFSKVPILVHVREMRKKLSKMVGCIRCPFRSSIQRSLGSRRYLLESSDFFALRDLVDLSKGAFAGTGYAAQCLMTLLTMGEHIRASIYPTVSLPEYNLSFDEGQGILPSLMESVSEKINLHITQLCSTCREVGESCAAGLKCQDSSCLIVPFQDDSKRCDLCGSVYHQSCFRKLSECLSCCYTLNSEYPCKEFALVDELDARSHLSSDSNSKSEDPLHISKEGSASSKGLLSFIGKKIVSNIL